MKSVAIAVFLLGMAISPAWAICLREQDIRSAASSDGKTLKLQMRDGKVWNSQLKGSCPGLKFHGFVWVMHDPQGICENMESLKVLESGQICILGKFSLMNEH